MGSAKPPRTGDGEGSSWHLLLVAGKRQGQRSVRLSKAYRAIYVEHETGEVELIEVLQVNKHEYR
jgi:proteic killer suppression protein